MTDIIIHFHDHLRCRLECNQGVAYEIAEEFSFFVPGYKFMPQYKSGRWDGRIKMLDWRTRQFYIGLLPRLIQWAQENGYTVSFSCKESFRNAGIEVDLAWFDERVPQIANFEPRDYQLASLHKAVTLSKSLILSPTGSGKSFIIYLLVRYLLEHGITDILITVPTISLVEQLHKDFKDYVKDDWDVDAFVGKVVGGENKNPEQPVVISTWQSIFRLPKSYFSRYKGYICDEAHQADAKSISGIIDNLGHAPFRCGLTGTLDGTLLHELEMVGRFGPIYRAATTKELMDDGALAALEIDCLVLKYPEEECKEVRKMDYATELEYIVTHPERNRLLAKLALRQSGNTLMLFNFIQKHGEILYKLLQADAEKAGKKIYYIHGATNVEDRERIREILERENNCILLASLGTTSTGVNVKNLHNLILAHPYKAKIKNLQSIGRSLRKAAGKTKAKLIDIGDDFSSVSSRTGKTKPNKVFEHFIERLKIYQGEQFQYRIVNLDISR